MPTTRTATPARIGVARLVRARHWAPLISTVPSGLTSASAKPISPTMLSRPIVGVEKRARTMAGIPATMNSGVPATPTIMASHDGCGPWVSVSVPMTRVTVPTTVQNRGAPACRSTV